LPALHKAVSTLISSRHCRIPRHRRRVRRRRLEFRIRERAGAPRTRRPRFGCRTPSPTVAIPIRKRRQSAVPESALKLDQKDFSNPPPGRPLNDMGGESCNCTASEAANAAARALDRVFRRAIPSTGEPCLDQIRISDCARSERAANVSRRLLLSSPPELAIPDRTYRAGSQLPGNGSDRTDTIHSRPLARVHSWLRSGRALPGMLGCCRWRL
jgi:hypothetical protein